MKNDAPGMAFRCDMRSVDGAAVIVVRGEVDMATGPELWSSIQAAAVLSDRVVIDLSEVSFMDSTGIGVIVRAQSWGQAPVLIVLRNPQPSVARLFALTGLDQHVEIER